MKTLLCLAVAALGAPRPAAVAATGVIVMAHGGDETWNRAVLDSVKPLEAKVPVEVAFGMADADTLQEAVGRLEARGVRRISVVRLFISGESFLKRTRKILGLDPGAPPSPGSQAPAHAHDPHAGHGGMPMFHDPDTMPLWRVKTRSRIVVDEEGLLDSDVSARVMAERAGSLSKNPAKESVLILAHGAGSEAENARWREGMERIAAAVRAAKPFRDVRVETLREDWPDKKKEAEARIRAQVSEAAKTGAALVVPYRVYGFGPYTETLEGLTYVSDGQGLLPHPLVSRWLLERAADTFKKAGWQDAAF